MGLSPCLDPCGSRASQSVWTPTTSPCALSLLAMSVWGLLNSRRSQGGPQICPWRVQAEEGHLGGASRRAVASCSGKQCTGGPGKARPDQRARSRRLLPRGSLEAGHGDAAWTRRDAETRGPVSLQYHSQARLQCCSWVGASQT